MRWLEERCKHSIHRSELETHLWDFRHVGTSISGRRRRMAPLLYRGVVGVQAGGFFLRGQAQARAPPPHRRRRRGKITFPGGWVSKMEVFGQQIGVSKQG